MAEYRTGVYAATGEALWAGTVTASSEEEAVRRRPAEARDVYQAMPWGPPDSYDLRERAAMTERCGSIEELGREIRNAEVERLVEAAKETRMTVCARPAERRSGQKRDAAA